jgi:hypothetical protein
MEVGYRSAIVLSIGLEVATIVLPERAPRRDPSPAAERAAHRGGAWPHDAQPGTHLLTLEAFWPSSTDAAASLRWATETSRRSRGWNRAYRAFGGALPRARELVRAERATAASCSS